MKENSTIKTIEKMIKSYKEADECGLSNNDFKNEIKALSNILSDYKRVLKINEVLLKENERLKEYIMLAPNLDEMTATKYSNIQQDAYIQGRAEEQQKAEQIIYKNYIPIQKIKDKIENNKEIMDKINDGDLIHALIQENKVLQELLGENNDNR